SDFTLGDLVDCSYLSGLEVLALEFFEPDPPPVGFSRSVALLGDEEAAALAACRHLSGLTSLYLQNNRIGPDGIDALLRSPHLGPMERLGLNDNPIGDTGVARLSASPWLRRLVFLDLERSNLSDDALESLASGRPERLQTLKLGGDRTRIGASGV